MPLEGTEEVVLKGLLVRSAWSDVGEVVELSLMTYDEEEYSIDLAEVGVPGLLNLVRQRVRMVAIVHGGRVVRVTHAEVLRGE